jgi:anti-sigma factor RsiW
MECKNVQILIDGYVDNELPLVETSQIDDHLRGCMSCSQMYQDRRALCDRVRSTPVYFKAPDELRQKVQKSLRRVAAVPSPRRLARPWLRLATSLAAAAVIALMLFPVFRTLPPGSETAQEVVSSHIRSLMANHLTDVPSSDEHTVKPWFDGKLDFAPPVQNPASQGFPLVGGRLDYINNRPVAALIYRYKKHFVNTFLWPSEKKTPDEVPPVTIQGYHVYHWAKDGMTYWAVSDLEQRELERFVRILQGQIEPSK